MIRFLSLITLINTVSQSRSDITGTLVTGEIFRVSGLDQDDLLRDPRSWRGSNRVPKFEFYIYNDAGAMVKQYLTFQEIQHLLLQQSVNLGLAQLGYLLGRNKTSFTSTTTTTQSTTQHLPLPLPTNSHQDTSEVWEVIDKIQDLIDM